MAQLFQNNAWSALNGSIAPSSTTINLAAGTGARFPSPTGSDYFLLTLTSFAGGTESAWEIVKVTARSVDALTVVRAQENTAAQTWASGTPCDLRVTAATLDARTTEHEAKSDPHTQYVQVAGDVLAGPMVFSAEVDNGSSGTAKTINWGSGQKHKLTLTGNCTLTFTNPAGAADFKLRLIQDATGGRSLTWPAGTKFYGGTVPAINTAANSVSLFSVYFDGATYWVSGGGFA